MELLRIATEGRQTVAEHGERLLGLASLEEFEVALALEHELDPIETHYIWMS